MRPSGILVIVLSFFIALGIAIVPLPDWAIHLRPEAVTMVLIYWCLAIPDRVGVGVGWLVGLFVDVAKGAILGQYALSFTVVAWLSLKLHQRIRVFPPWQQALSILILVGLSQIIVLWVKGIIGQSPQNWVYWLPTLTSCILWPWFFPLMRRVRHYYKVN